MRTGKSPGWLQRAREATAKYRLSLGGPSFRAEASGDNATLLVYDAIGEDPWFGGGVKAADVAAFVATLKGQRLDVRINSPGGYIDDAKAIKTQLDEYRAKGGEVVIHVDGLAASAATHIAMAGSTIITAPAATWMIHRVQGFGMGNADDFMATAAVLEMEDETFAKVYASRTKTGIRAVREMMAAETWMNAQQALEAGFTDEIADTAPTASADVDMTALARVLRQATQDIRGLAA